MTANKVSEKWGRNLKASIPYVVEGIANVSESPAEKAIRKQDKMRANLMRAIDNGTWASQLGKVTLAEWKKKTTEKVQQRLSGGVDAGMAKRQEFDNYLVDTINGILPTIKDMPDMTLEDSINRVSTFMRHMSDNPYRGR